MYKWAEQLLIFVPLCIKEHCLRNATEKITNISFLYKFNHSWISATLPITKITPHNPKQINYR